MIKLLNDFNGNTDDIDGHINWEILDAQLNNLKTAYTVLVQSVHSIDGLEDLPILVHGYDYPFPYPAGTEDPRDPDHARKDQWLGSAFSPRQIDDQSLRRGILKKLIDRLYDLLNSIAIDIGNGNVHVVDCRGTMPSIDFWIDEIHGNDSGFANVAQKFRDKLSDVTRDSNSTPS